MEVNSVSVARIMQTPVHLYIFGHYISGFLGLQISLDSTGCLLGRRVLICLVVLSHYPPSIYQPYFFSLVFPLQNATDDEMKKQLAKAFEDKHKNELASKVLATEGGREGGRVGGEGGREGGRGGREGGEGGREGREVGKGGEGGKVKAKEGREGR